MKTLPISAGKNEIKNLVIEWNELLAQEKYMEALDLILYDNTQQIDGEEWIWTPERLEAAVFTYGQPWYSKEDMKQLYGLDYPVDSKVTSLLTDSDKENRLENIEISIRFLYKGIIIKHNKTEPTYTKTSLFLCEKRRFFMAWFWKGVVLISN